MPVTQAFLAEFENEAKTTRRVLERVPADKLTWKPHPKSMSLGHLAWHVATIPGLICRWAHEDVTEFSQPGQPAPASTAETVAEHAKSVAIVRQILGSLTADEVRKN